MNQRELEKLTGIPQSTLSKMSDGKADLGKTNVERISKFLELPVYDIRNRDQIDLYLDICINAWKIKTNKGEKENGKEKERNG